MEPGPHRWEHMWEHQTHRKPPSTKQALSTNRISNIPTAIKQRDAMLKRGAVHASNIPDRNLIRLGGMAGDGPRMDLG
ncbi:hypothetical protein N7537_002999 [Penicillium hordei]|uniref:Uncharacterized protein n=1 Tax=Penicillium hordei TaxID=40994 RepID=A0AAD6EIJ7_9EURO|nr:uncharacterized protein N7537_002999 [Penicillium hordei]KAJ5617885.1 hypothetical protein N7537_002999 [Penicillium hordei]